MEFILTCKQCGHEEHGQTERLFMAKVRMWNHLNHEHPALTDPFIQAVEEQTADAHRQAA